MLFIIMISAYLALGYLLHGVIFKEKKPPISNYFKPGQELHSRSEGFKQTVIKQTDGYVHCSLEIAPFAGGPPKHIHTGFDETFRVENGELTIWVDGTIKKIVPGQVLTIPKGTPHKPYNETGDTIRLKGAIAFPENFAFHLAQVYGVMDSQPGFEHSPGIFFQMPLFQRNGFDSYQADGPPVALQKILGFVVTPLSRLLGYKSYYAKYDPVK